MHSLGFPGIVASLVVFLPLSSSAAEWKSIEPVTDNIVCLRFDDLVSIEWGKLGSNGHEDNLVTAPLDVDLASKLDTYQVQGNTVTKVGRKTRPHTFAHTPQAPCSHALDHRIYLVLAKPLKPGDALTVTVPKALVTSGPTTMTFTFDPTQARSETVQVNQVDYLPDAAKYGYVSAWLGDLGAQTFTEGTPFAILDAQTHKPVFTGQLKFRKAADQPDNGEDVGNFYRANLYECDFSALTTPGTYVLSVDGIGCSYPFQVNADGYRQAYITTMRGLYHQRCGIALTAPFTEWTRPVCHVEPLMQTDHRYMDQGFSDGPPPDAQTWKTTGEMRNDVFGGYHDAGDWDREASHPDIPSYLLLAYELTPDHYAEKELNIPESGNGLPDIINEARWGEDYYRKIQRPNGGVSIGMFESHWPNEGQISSTDTLKKYCYAEEPVATFKQSAAAAHLALALIKLGHADDAKIYTDSALRAWAWGNDPANLHPGDEKKIRDDRLHAAAALYRLTKDTKFQDSFKKDLAVHSATDSLISWPDVDQSLGIWTYIFAEDDLPGLDKNLRETLRKASVYFADYQCVATSAKRGDRRGYDWYWPFMWGHGVQAKNFPLMIAHKLTGDKKYVDVMVANCDLTLGNNPLNMAYVTGLGAKSPKQIMQINYWYDPKGPNPGVTIMGPTAYDPKLPPAKGEWEVQYAWQYVYPPAKEWPPLELWFEDRYCAQTNEFIVANEAVVACAFGYLTQPVKATVSK